MADETPYYSGAKLTLLNIALGLGTFIQILDTSIANVAIPYISGSLAVSPDQGTWVITSFAASNAIVLPLTGWLSDYFGRVKLFVMSVLLFSLASFLCGFSSSLAMLVVFRVFQGAVAGTLIPLSQALLMSHNPESRRGGALGFWAMVVVVAPVAGPILGGYISEEYSWPWIFYINVPIGVFSALTVWFLLKDRDSKVVRNRIDWVGLTLLAIGVGCMQIMLDKGKDLDWFNSNVIITLTIISLIAMAYFTIWNAYQTHPIVDFTFFKDRNFLIGTFVTTVGYLLFFGSIVIIPLWLQTEMNYTAFWAGIAVAPIGVAAVVFSTWIGANLYRFDLRTVTAFSFLLFSLGFFLQSTFTTQVDIQWIMFVRFFQGFGVSIFFIPLLQLSLGHIPTNKYASAAGLFNFIRILVGSGFGTSVSIQVWTNLEIFHHSRLAEATTPYRYATELYYQTPHVSQGFLDRVLDLEIQHQAFMLASNDLAYFAGWAFLAMIPFTLLCKPVSTKPAAVSAGAH